MTYAVLTHSGVELPSDEPLFERHFFGLPSADETVCATDPFGLLARDGGVRRRCVDRNGASNTAFKETKRQRPNSGSNVEECSAQASCLRNAILEHACRSPWTALAIALQFFDRLLFVELSIRRALEPRATG